MTSNLPNTFETEAEFLKRLPHLQAVDGLNQNFRPNFLLFQWHITNRCNLRCLHCYQDDHSLDTDLSLLQLYEILDQYIQLLEIWKIRGHINITGGEPLMNPYLFNLLENIHLHQSHCGFAMLSNGTYLTHEIGLRLKQLGCSFFQISIEGSKSDHDKIRGAGNFEKCIHAIEILKKHHIQTMVSFTASKLNVDSFDEVAKFCRKKGVDVLWSDRYLPMGKGKEMQDALMHPLEVDAFFKKMYVWHHRFKRNWFTKTELRMHRALNFLTTHEKGCNCYAPYNCSAGRSLITVLPNGDLVPCRRMPIVAGNILDSGLENLYSGSAFMQMLRKTDIPYPGCENCENWKDCKGGLRCLSYAIYDNPFNADPQCLKKN